MVKSRVGCALLGCLITSFLSMGSLTLAHASPPPQEQLSMTGAETALAKAREAAKPVVINELTNELSQTTANPDGTFTLTTSRVPLRTRKNNTWKDIDTTLVKGVDGRYHTKATALDMSFSPGGTQPLATSTTGDQTLDLRLPFSLPEPQLNGSTLTYPDVLPDVDLVVNASADTFSEVLVVKTAKAALHPELANLKVQIDTKNLTLKVNPDGSTDALDNNRKIIFHSSPPASWDSTTTRGERPSSLHTADNKTPIKVASAPPRQLPSSRQTTRTEAILTPEPQTTTGTAPTYPVYIDPSFSSTLVAFRTVITNQSGYGNDNDYLRVGYCGWTPDCTTPYTKTFTARSYIQFQTPLLAPRYGTTATIKWASLSATIISSSSLSQTGISLHRANYFDQTTRWPGPLSTEIQTTWASGNGTPLRFDNAGLTTYLQEAANNGSQTIHFALKAPNESDKYEFKKIANNPVLTVTYAFPVGQPTYEGTQTLFQCGSKAYATNTQPVFRSKASDYNPNPSDVAIIHQLLTPSGSVQASGVTVNAHAAIHLWTPPAPLPPGTYVYRIQSAQTTEGTTYYSPWAYALEFHVDTTAPNAPLVISHTHPEQIDASQTLPELSPRGNTTSQGGEIKFLVPNNPNIAGYTYSWTGTPPSVTNLNCTSPTSEGYIKATGGTASININQPAGPHTLTVRAISNTGQVSPSTNYRLQVTPNDHTVIRVEGENLPVTATGEYGTEIFTQVSNGKRLHFSPTQLKQSITVTFNIPTDGQWIIQPESARSNSLGITQFAIDNNLVTLKTVTDDLQITNKPLTLDHYSPTHKAISYPFPVKQLTAGPHTLTITTIGKNPNSTSWYNSFLSTPRNDYGMNYVLDQLRLIKLP